MKNDRLAMKYGLIMAYRVCGMVYSDFFSGNSGMECLGMGNNRAG